VVRAAIMSSLALIAGRYVLRTDQQGAITLETDGERLWAEVQR
jgi:beta-lactamase superfamily II metal-dependent hydrolase